jgi:hypothetical protein
MKFVTMLAVAALLMSCCTGCTTVREYHKMNVAYHDFDVVKQMVLIRDTTKPGELQQLEVCGDDKEDMALLLATAHQLESQTEPWFGMGQFCFEAVYKK